MSVAVDQYLLQEMRDEDDLDLMIESGISGVVIDHLSGLNEETGTYDVSPNLLFPQPIRRIDF